LADISEPQVLPHEQKDLFIDLFFLREQNKKDQ